MEIEHSKKGTFASLMAMFLILTFLMAMLPFATAHSGDTMDLRGLKVTPTIDGIWSSGEWDDAAEYVATNSTLTSYVRVKHDSDYLYILVDSVWDTTNQTAWDFENTWIAIDTAHDGGTAPQSDDYLFHIGGMNAWQGNGSQWVWMMVPSDFAGASSSSSWGPGVQPSPKDSTPHRIDEIKIPLSYVGSVGSTGLTVGFYVFVVDDSSDPDGTGPQPATIGVEWPAGAGGNPGGWPAGMMYMDPCPAPNNWGDLTFNAVMEAPPLSVVPTIDGIWSSGEWNDAPEYSITGSGGTSYVRVKYDANYLYILVDSPWDTTNQTLWDFENTWIAIDTSLDGGTAPQPDDYLFHVGGMNAWQGNGSQWVWMAVPSDFAGASSSSSWGPGVQPSPKNATAHRIDEMKIPLTYVGSSSGLYVMVTDDSTDPDGTGPQGPTAWVEWPTAAGGNSAGWPAGMMYMDPCPAPNNWGDLMLAAPAVGGIVTPVDKLALLAPYIALAAVMVAAIVGVIYARKRWFGKTATLKP